MVKEDASMENEEIRKQHAMLDWQNELEAQKNRLPFLDGAEKAACEARIAECKQWIAKLQAM